MKQTVRMTHQREIILDELKRTRTHPTADELYTRVKKRLPRISLATVYRNLETLSSAGLVSKLEITGRQKRFDWNQQPHDHISCTECHRIDDILPKSGASRSCEMPVDHHGYTLTGWRVEYFGICLSCQHKKDKEMNMSTAKLNDSQQAILKAMSAMDSVCGSKDLVILGLSLANWSFLILVGFLGASAWLIFGGKNRFASVRTDSEEGNSQRRN